MQNHPPPTARPGPTSDRNPWGDAVGSLLAQHCGSCHRPGLPTTNPGALLVFNLDENPWYDRMSQRQLEALRGRVRGTKAIDEADRIVVERFLECALNGACDETLK